MRSFCSLTLTLLLGFTFITQTPAQKTEPEPIRVGVFFDLSGPTASLGQTTLDGVKLAVADINERGGIAGRRVELFIEDDLGRADLAAAAVEKLISKNQVHAIVGGVGSGNALAGAMVAQSKQVPMVTPYAPHPSVVAAGDYIFRASFSDPFQAEAMAEFAAKTLKAKRAAVLFDFNSDYSKSLSGSFEQRLLELGGQVVSKQNYATGDQDFKGQLTAIRSSRPDLIFVPGYYAEAAMIAKQARELRMKLPLLGGDGWDSGELWKLDATSLNGSYIVNQFAADAPFTASREFVSRFAARYEGRKPDALAALGYDAVNMLADAIKRAGTTERAALKKTLADTNNLVGATGTISLDMNRNAIKPAIILKLKDGKFLFHAVTPAPDLTKVGIPECDEYLANYDACVGSRVPVVARPQYKIMLEQMRSAWRKRAEDPTSRVTLVAACKQAMTQAQTIMKTYGCKF
ncbi:MAG TPA: ABC transporter substrate-binding protein [Pyrinomonadaceae bacterium]|nr:ABC transporter substrate-binding protein [Pyrinomonadaceae bacterium]